MHGFGAFGRADLEHHVERGTRRAAVQRTLERADRAGDGGDDVRPCRHDDARGERRRVEPVIADGVEVRLERPRAVGRRLGARKLMQVVRGVTEIHAHATGGSPCSSRQYVPTIVGNAAIAVIASSSGSSRRPRLSIGAAMRSASIGGVFGRRGLAQTARSPTRGSSRRAARSRREARALAGSGSRPFSSR